MRFISVVVSLSDHKRSRAGEDQQYKHQFCQRTSEMQTFQLQPEPSTIASEEQQFLCFWDLWPRRLFCSGPKHVSKCIAKFVVYYVKLQMSVFLKYTSYPLLGRGKNVIDCNRGAISIGGPLAGFTGLLKHPQIQSSAGASPLCSLMLH